MRRELMLSGKNKKEVWLAHTSFLDFAMFFFD
jgi:hypothetical protein